VPDAAADIDSTNSEDTQNISLMKIRTGLS
jgi:hypothetical protein